jgi:hypothetical protein
MSLKLIYCQKRENHVIADSLTKIYFMKPHMKNYLEDERERMFVEIKKFIETKDINETQKSNKVIIWKNSIAKFFKFMHIEMGHAGMMVMQKQPWQSVYDK